MDKEEFQSMKMKAMAGDYAAVLEIATLVETLTRDLAGAHQGLRLAQERTVPRVANNPVSGATIDSDEFRQLMDACAAANKHGEGNAYNAVIAYIDARIAAAEHKAWCEEVNADGAREHLAEVLAAWMVNKRDAELWRKWLPWMNRLGKVPFNLAKDLRAYDAAMAAAEGATK